MFEARVREEEQKNQKGDLDYYPPSQPDSTYQDFYPSPSSGGARPANATPLSYSYPSPSPGAHPSNATLLPYSDPTNSASIVVEYHDQSGSAAMSYTDTTPQLANPYSSEAYYTASTPATVSYLCKYSYCYWILVMFMILVITISNAYDIGY